MGHVDDEKIVILKVTQQSVRMTALKNLQITFYVALAHTALN